MIGRIPHAAGRSWEYDPRARALDERLDRIDLELEGLARIRCEGYCASLRDRGFDVSGIRPLVATPWESRVETWERRRARAALNRFGGLRRDGFCSNGAAVRSSGFAEWFS